MTGLRILGVLALLVAALAWAVFGSGDAVEDDRGWVETEAAFEALEDALVEFEPLYQEVVARGFMIELKTTVQSLRERLGALREERLRLREDASVPRGKRLPAYRELVRESDVALAALSGLSASVRARYEFFVSSEPLLELARQQGAALRSLPGLDDDARRRADSLGTALGALEARARDAQVLLGKAPAQNEAFAQAVLKELRRLVEVQAELLEP